MVVVMFQMHDTSMQMYVAVNAQSLRTSEACGEEPARQLLLEPANGVRLHCPVANCTAEAADLQRLSFPVRDELACGPLCRKHNLCNDLKLSNVRLQFSQMRPASGLVHWRTLSLKMRQSLTSVL